jgi:hypothetical protein
MLNTDMKLIPFFNINEVLLKKEAREEGMKIEY